MRSVMVLSGLVLWCEPGSSATRYYVRLATASGNSARLAFDFSCNDSSVNKATLLTLRQDGVRAQSIYTGGPITGDILAGANSADTSSLEGASFFSEILLQLNPLGSFMNFDLDLTEHAPSSGRPEDEFAFFFLAGEDTLPYSTSDPLGTNALFAIDVTGAPGGDLGVFSPMTFVPPDTLRLDASLVDVVSLPTEVARLRFSGALPNPFSGTVRFDFVIPIPGGMVRLKVFDAAGRLVAEPLRGTHKPGEWSAVWNGRNIQGDACPPGVYLVQLQIGGQSLVRRIVIAR